MQLAIVQRQQQLALSPREQVGQPMFGEYSLDNTFF